MNRMAAIWYTQWQHHIQMARLKPNQSDGYCRAACIAQAQYLIATIQYKERKPE